MAHVQVQVNGRTYQIACDDGQETHVARLGRYLDQRVTNIIKGVGQVGDQRLLVMAALMIADDLAETDSALTQLRGDDSQAAREARAHAVVAGAPSMQLPPGIDETLVAEAIEKLAMRIEGIAASLAQD